MPHQLKSHPRKFGKDSRCCRITGRNLGLIRKYDIMMCRQAFRENAEHIGFVKYRWTGQRTDKQELIQFGLAWQSLPPLWASQPINTPGLQSSRVISRDGGSGLGCVQELQLDRDGATSCSLLFSLDEERKNGANTTSSYPPSPWQSWVLNGLADCANCLNADSHLSHTISLFPLLSINLLNTKRSISY